MEFLAGTWLIWLIVAVVLWGYVFINQINRMRGMWKSDFDKAGKAFFAGLVPMILAALVATVCFVLFIVGIIAKFVLS